MPPPCFCESTFLCITSVFVSVHVGVCALMSVCVCACMFVSALMSVCVCVPIFVCVRANVVLRVYARMLVCVRAR